MTASNQSPLRMNEMTPADIIALGQSLYGDPWLEKMAADLEYSVSQLWRVAYDGAPPTKRMKRRLDQLAKKHQVVNCAATGKR
jgi:hypothetical protein